MNANVFDRISFWSLFLTVVLLPVFFLPFTKIPVEVSKGLLLVLGLCVSLIFWALARFSDGKVVLPRSLLLLAGALIVLLYFVSSFFSGATGVSLFGTMFDVGTFWFMFAAFILMLLCAVVFRDRANAKMVLLGTILSATVLFIFQTLHTFFAGRLAFGLLAGKTANIFGSWNSLGFFAAFSVIMCLIVIEFFSVSKLLKWFLQALIVLSLLVVVAVNFSLIWILLCIFTLIIFVYKISINYSRGTEGGKAFFPLFSFAVVIISLLFLIAGQFIGGVLPAKLGLANNEVGPNLKGTMAVTRSVLQSHPVLGLGPNRFSNAWALYKPALVNSTPFWDVPFSFGSGVLPTFLATNGYLGILAWLAFFVLLILTGVRAFFSTKKELNLDLITFFVMSLFLFLASFVYATGATIFLLAFAFTGIFIGIYSSSRPEGELAISFLNDPRKSFFLLFSLIFIVIGSIAISFKYGERLASFVYFNNALAAPTTEAAESSLNKAVALYQNDLYLRTYAQVYLLKLNSLAAKGTQGTALSEADKALLQTNFNQAVAGAQAAIAYDPKNYLNFRALGSVYQNVATLGVKDASERATAAYKAALLLNPLNPGLDLALARVALAAGQTQDAKNYANAALALKPDYVEALLTLSQIAKSQGNMTDALAYALRAQAAAPNNKDIAQYIESLKAQ